MIRLVSPRQLQRQGILGMNERNINYIGKHNARRLFPVVDNKLKTKETALNQGIPTPELYGVVDHQFQVRDLPTLLSERPSFVIKPVQGSGGKGILVVIGRDGHRYIKSSGARIDDTEITRHASNILAGLHSLGGRNDYAMIEALIDFDPYLKEYSYEGVPDIRVVVYRGVPVMAMMRCATHASDGKANLHQGAVGVGLDMGNGRSICAVQNGQVVDCHPDLGTRFEQLQVPHWTKILELAARCAAMTGLGYLGADIVLDRQRGPMLLELNARPGLSIQVANQKGLNSRFCEADKIASDAPELDEIIRRVQQRFSG